MKTYTGHAAPGCRPRQRAAIPGRQWWKALMVVFLFWGVLGGCQSGEERPPESNLEAIADQEAAAHLSKPIQAETPSVSKDIVAVVNDEPITVTQLADRLHHEMEQADITPPFDEYTVNRLREKVLTALIEKTLIAQKAKEQQISITDQEFQERVQGIQEEYHGTDIREILSQQGRSYALWKEVQQEALLLEKLIEFNMSSMVVVSPEEVRQYYEEHKEKYDHPAQIRARQILLYDESIARQALQELQAGADFASVAQKYSESSDAKDGGDLGFFARGVMPPEFDDILFSLNVGERSDVVKTPYGYQLFQLTDQREAHRIGFEDAKAQIETLLKKQKQMLAVDLWMADLQRKAKIVLNHELITQVK